MGISYARNAAVQEARGDVIAFTDDDCEAAPGWLENVMACFEEDPRLGFVTGALVGPAGPRGLLSVCPEIHPEDMTYDPVRDKKNAPPRFDFAGANFAVRREVAQRVGHFDECLGVGAVFGSSEDLDYMLRIEAAGVRMRSTPKSVIHHTYGVRYGLKAVFKHRRSYAVGQGALAAKMTLRGDPRGKEWLDMVWGDLLQTVKELRLHRSPSAFLRYLYVRKAYLDCVNHHEVDASTGLYKPKPAI
jgi:GT2 family glycosyltransferase